MILNIFGFLHLSLVDVLDIIVVALIIFFLFKWLKNSSARNIFVAIILLLILRVFAFALNMKMLSALLGTVIDIGAIALVVIFQPEIRQFLNRMGRNAGLSKTSKILDRIFRRQDSGLQDSAIEELATACKEMAEEKTGALIVLRHRDSIADIIDTGDTVDAEIRQRLIKNIFFKNSPLHDGATVIGNGRIIAARCTLPITDRADIPAHFGMRHKAAVGISERSDASVIVVSEQTGTISYIREGVITPVQGKNALKLILEQEAKQ